MLKIKYDYMGKEIQMPWSEANEELAKAEATNGEYIIEDDGQPQEVTATTDDVLNILLGVANNG